MRKELIFLLFLLSFVIVSAADFEGAKRIVSGTYYDGETVVANNRVLTLMISTNFDKVGFIHENTFDVVYNNSCQRIIDIGICVKNIIEVEDRTERADHGKSKAAIEIYDLKASVNISRTISEGSLIVGEDTTIDVVLKNNADDDKNISYVDEFPKGIELVDSTDILIIGNKVYWSGLLSSHEEIKFSYVVRAVDDVDSYLKARLFYDNNNYYSTSIHFVSKTVLGQTFKWKFNPIAINQETELNITLSNLENESIDVNNFTVIFPDTLIVSKGNMWSWSGSIGKNGSEVFNFEVIPLTSGGKDVITQTSFDFKDKQNLSVSKKSTLDVSEADLIIRIGFGDPQENENSIESLQTKPFRVDIQKPNNDIFLRNINITINGSAVNKTNIFLNKLDTVDNVRVATMNFTAPDSQRGQRFKIFVYASFETEFGELKTVDEDFDITVNPISDLEIKHDVDTSVNSGDDFNVDVSVKNKRDVAANNVLVCHHLNFSNEAQQCRTVSIDASQDLDVFAYTIVAPRVNKTTTYLMSTSVAYNDSWHNYNFSKETNINVAPPDLKLTVRRTVDSKDVFVGNIVDVDYTITNSQKETLANVILYFTPSQYFDTAGNLSYFVGNIDPGEVINLYGIEKVRPKKNDTRTVASATAFYNDLFFGDIHNSSSGDLRLSVDNGYVSGPMIIINKTVPKEWNESKPFVVNLTLTNVGSSAYSVNVFDSGINWSGMVYTSQPVVISYNMSLDSIGKQKLDKAVVKYNYDNNNFTTASNIPEIVIKAVKIEKPSNETIIKNITKIVVPEKPRERSTIMQQIIDFIRGLFK